MIHDIEGLRGEVAPPATQAGWSRLEQDPLLLALAVVGVVTAGVLLIILLSHLG